jgi:hypothetical protein
LLGSGFFKARGGLFFNNLEEVNHTREVDLGVAGFRLYVSPIAVESSMAMGATQALK